MLDIACQQTAEAEGFRADVAIGLSQVQKKLPSRWLRDNRDCDVFEGISRLDEHYPTRTEAAILGDNAREIADFCGEKAVLLEYGVGAGIRTEVLMHSICLECTSQSITRGTF